MSTMKNYPFLEVFKLYKDRMSAPKIAKELDIPVSTVDAITRGILDIPPSQIQAIKNAGFTICSCCRRRIVPVFPIGYTQLTRLCYKCYKKGEPELTYSLSPLNNLINLNLEEEERNEDLSIAYERKK